MKKEQQSSSIKSAAIALGIDAEYFGRILPLIKQGEITDSPINALSIAYDKSKKTAYDAMHDKEVAMVSLRKAYRLTADVEVLLAYIKSTRIFEMGENDAGYWMTRRVEERLKEYISDYQSLLIAGEEKGKQP